MIMFGLTDLGNIVKLEVGEKDSEEERHLKIIEKAVILDTDKSTFSINYSSKYGDLVSDTITEDPKDIYERLAKAREEIEKRELSLMRNLFIIDKNLYPVKRVRLKTSKIKKTEE